MNQRQKRHIFEMLPMFFIGVFLVVYIVLCIVSGSRLEASLSKIETGWSVGGEAVEHLPERDLRAPGELSELRVTLGEDFDTAQKLCFYSVYEDVSVLLDGKVIYSYVRPETERLIQAAPNRYNSIPIPSGSAGKELTFLLSCPYSGYANHISDVYYGADAQIDRYIASQCVPRLAVAVAVLCIGIIFAIVALFLHYHFERNTGLYSLSLFVVVLAIFLACEPASLLLTLYDGTSYILPRCAAFMLCPVMYSRYLMRTLTGYRRRIAVGLNLISIFNIVAVLILQFVKARDLPEMMSSTRNLCILIIVYSFLLEIRREHRIVLCCFGGLLGYSFWHYYRTGTVSWAAYVIIFMYLYILVYRVIREVVASRAKEIRLEAALDVSKSELATVQITSHFFYHTLDSIRALIRLDADKAYKMTGDFAKYIRYRVDGVERIEETVPFSRELRSIRAYTDIKQAQLGERFCMETQIENEDFEILPLTVQPLVENAVIHAVQKRREGGLVRLVCREEAHAYHIEVIDNGPGATPESPQDSEKRSVAISNVNTRLEYYGIAPIRFVKNELGGMTASLDTPKALKRKEKNHAGDPR